MAEYFKKKIIGKLSEKPIIVKKITPQPKIETIIPIAFEEPEVPLEEPTPKKSRKKKVQ